MTTEIESKITEYYSLDPTYFRVLKSFLVTQVTDSATGEMQQQLSLVLAKNAEFSGEMLHLELFGVRNLRFEQPHFSLITLSHVEIVQAPPKSKFETPIRRDGC